MPRKSHTFHYLYKIICIITNKYYIGAHSTSNIDDGYMGSGKRIRYSINKYGIENHVKEIIEFLPDRKTLFEKEKEIVSIDLLNDILCMNLCIGGEGGLGGLSDESISKIRLGASNFLIKKWADEDYRKNHSIISSERFKNTHKNGKIKYDTFTGKNHSEKTKKLMSEKKIGKGLGETNSQFGTCWITKNNINKKIKKSELDSFLLEGWIKGRV